VALKTSPSGGARHSGEVYVIARRVSGLAAGVYHYDPARRALARIGRRSAPLPPMSVLLPGQPWYRHAPVLFVMTAVFARAQWRYAFPRAYRAVLIEAGHLCQTFCLVATALGLAPFCSMAFPDSRIESLLGLEAGHESALYIAGAGIPPAHGWRPWTLEAPWPRE
jgi:SagB-type dehydrogenase family enzyme